MSDIKPPKGNTPVSPALAALRRQIDEVDDALHDLLMRRAALVEEVARLKRDGEILPFRPGREAQILRRLVARHSGRFPRPVLVRIWRELLSGTVAMQTGLTVAVCNGCWDLARDHFGSHVPMLAAASPDDVTTAIGEGDALLGVVPLGEEEDRAPWWLRLAGGAAPLRVIARLPFGTLGNAAGDCEDAFVIAAMEPEPSGDDCTLLAIEGDGALKGAAVTDAFLAAGLDSNPLAAAHRDGEAAHLVEVDALVPSGDPRIERAMRPLGPALRTNWLGFYARPLPDAALNGVAPE